jgi:hypothetical protein
VDLQDGYRASGLSLTELWLGYITIGGNAAQIEVEAYLTGALIPDPLQHDILAHSLNEHFADQGLNYPVNYRN